MRLVELQVVVTGRDGQPAMGLTEADFTVLENGKPQKIAFLVAPAEMAAQRPEPLPAGLFTNRPEYTPGAPQGVTAVVVDVLNTGIEDQYFARSQVGRFLKGLKGEEQVALYVLSNRVRVVHDFSDDPESLARLAARMRNEWPAGGVDMQQAMRAEAVLFQQAIGGAPLDDNASDGIGGVPEMQQEMRIRTTLRALEMIGQRLAGVPGRKALVWVSAGVPMLTMATHGSMPGPRGSVVPAYRSFTKEFGQAVQRLAEANVAVYPVDARGLRVESDAPVWQPQLGTRAGGGDRVTFDNRWMGVPATETFSAMKYFAQATGGRAIYNTNDVAGGLRRAADDLQANYTLAYYTSLDEDAQKREMDVKVKHRGMEVLARRRVPAARRAGLLEVRDLLESPIAATGVLLNGHLTRSGGKLRVMLQIEPGNLLLSRNGDRTEGLVEVYLAQIRPSGQRSVVDSRMTLKLTEEALRKVVEQGLVFERTLDLDEEAERLRVVVRDARSGAAGTLDAPLRQIPSEK